MSEFTCIDKMIYIINTPTGLGYNTLRLVFSADQARECLRDGMAVQAANQQGEIVAEFGYGMYPLQVVQQTLFAFDAFHAAAAKEAPAEETSVDICVYCGAVQDSNPDSPFARNGFDCYVCGSN